MNIRCFAVRLGAMLVSGFNFGLVLPCLVITILMLLLLGAAGVFFAVIGVEPVAAALAVLTLAAFAAAVCLFVIYIVLLLVGATLVAFIPVACGPSVTS